MLKLLTDYQQYITQLQQKLTNHDDYLSKFSQKATLPQQILKQQQQIQNIINQLKSKQKLEQQIKSYKNNLIPDHYLHTSTLIKQKWISQSQTQPPLFDWSQHLKTNHKFHLTLTIKSIQPITHHYQQHQTQLNFDQLTFHLHHIDQYYTSPPYKYSPQLNLYQQADLLDKCFIMKGQRHAKLHLEHVIRQSNLLLCLDYFKNMGVKVVAESSYGLVLGVAELRMEEDDLVNQRGRRQRCIIFRNRCEDVKHENFGQFQNTLIANIQYSVEIYPIAPIIKQLEKNSLNYQKKRKTSKSKSPNKLISTAPPQRPFSPKRKKQYLTDIIKPTQQLTYLTVFQSHEYKHKLPNFNLQKGKQITYKQIQNIKQRKIQLVKINKDYYLKLYLQRQYYKDKGILMFQFNSCQYCVYVVENHLYQIMSFQEFSRVVRRQGEKIKIGVGERRNKIVCLSDNKCAYIRSNIKIVKNSIRQNLINGILANIYIKTQLKKCQIMTSLPFIITDITHQQYGYLIHFYYQKREHFNHYISDKILIFLRSTLDNLIQIHIFDCHINPRLQSSQTIYKQLLIKDNQTFFNLSLKNITNQNYIYNIRTTSSFINIVNGKDFKYHHQDNQDLIIQIIKPIQSTLIIDLIFYDNKYRCFFMKLVIIEQEEDEDKDEEVQLTSVIVMNEGMKG